MNKIRKKTTSVLAGLVALTIGLAACSTPETTDGTTTEQPQDTTTEATTDDTDDTVDATDPVTTDETDTTDAEAAFAEEEGSQRVLQIGYDGGFCQAAIAVAHLHGYFEDEGLQTELTRTGGIAENRDAIALGQLDTSVGMIAAWLKPVTAGVDIRFTVGLHTGCTSAFVLADSDITEFEAGQNVAISGGIGGVNHNIAYRFIEHDGFAPEDFTWRDYAADQLLLILQQGEADVAIIGDQLAEQWVADGTLRRIRSLHEDEDFVDESCCVLGIRGQFLDENPITSEKITRAVYKASQWIGESTENKLETVQLLFEHDYISGSEEYALSLYELFEFGLSNEQTEKTLFATVDEYQKLGIIDADLDPEVVKEQIWHPFDIEND